MSGEPNPTVKFVTAESDIMRRNEPSSPEVIKDRYSLDEPLRQAGVVDHDSTRIAQQEVVSLTTLVSQQGENGLVPLVENFEELIRFDTEKALNMLTSYIAMFGTTVYEGNPIHSGLYQEVVIGDMSDPASLKRCKLMGLRFDTSSTCWVAVVRPNLVEDKLSNYYTGQTSPTEDSPSSVGVPYSPAPTETVRRWVRNRRVSLTNSDLTEIPLEEKVQLWVVINDPALLENTKDFRSRVKHILDKVYKLLSGSK